MTFGLCLFIFGFCFVLRRREGVELLLTATWERRVTALSYALPVIPAVGFIYLALRRTVSAKRALPLVGVLVLSAAGAVYIHLSDPSWLFGPRLSASATSPEGREAAIWAGNFFGCEWDLYLAEPHEMLSHRVDRYPVECAGMGTPMIRWLPDGGAALDVDGGVPAKPFTLFPAWN